MRFRIRDSAVLATVAGALFLVPAQAEPGVSKDNITFGQIAAMTGPAQALGQGMREGLLAAFAELNAKGGVNGRTLALKTIDDGYEPERTVAAMKAMLGEDAVFAFTGPVGSPTAKAAQPLATEAKVPFIGAFSGAEFLRNPYNRYVVNVRASYFQEAEAWIEHLTKDLGITRVAVLYQDDTFGLAGLEGVKLALLKRNLPLSGSGSFKRNTTAVKSALLDIMKERPEAVIAVAPYKPVAKFVKIARQVKFETLVGALSFVGSEALAQELDGAGTGVAVSQVVPFPWDDSIPAVGAYRDALTRSAPEAKPGFVSFEGYLVGRLVIDALQRMPGEPTREALLDAIHNGTFDFGGVTLRYTAKSNQGSNEVYFTVLQPDGAFKPVTRLSRPAAH